MASIIKADNGVSSGVTGIVQTADSSGQLALQTTTSGGTATTAITIDNSQNVGVGVTPSAWTTSGSTKALEMTNGVSLSSYGSAAGLYQNAYVASGGYTYKTTATASAYQQGGGVHYWLNAPPGTAGNPITTFTQAMTLDNTGNLLVGQTTQTYTSVGFSVLGTGSAAPGTVNSTLSTSTNAVSSYNLYSTGASAFRFYVTMDGTIHATSTSITAISDVSLKTNIKPLETGLAEINRLQPRRFDWLDQTVNEGTNIAGFISQEVQEVLPDLTPNFKYNETETKLGLKMGDMIPTMVKAIQELSAEVTALKAKIGV
jgi:hypothetical protein